MKPLQLQTEHIFFTRVTFLKAELLRYWLIILRLEKNTWARTLNSEKLSLNQEEESPKTSPLTTLLKPLKMRPLKQSLQKLRITAREQTKWREANSPSPSLFKQTKTYLLPVTKLALISHHSATSHIKLNSLLICKLLSYFALMLSI